MADENYHGHCHQHDHFHHLLIIFIIITIFMFIFIGFASQFVRLDRRVGMRTSMPAHGLYLFDFLDTVMRTEPWTRQWLTPLPGRLVCATAERTFEVRCLDVPTPARLIALGCGGWSQEGVVRWTGIDLDVGHGSRSYRSLTDAIAAAMSMRLFLNGALEIRLSRSGEGAHLRIPLVEGVTGGLSAAARIAKWLARKLELEADSSPLGRQNFWFWACQPGPRGFRLIAPHEGLWTPPTEALREATAVVLPRLHSVSSSKRALSCLSRRTIDFIENGCPKGQRNYRLFIAAADISGVGFSEEETLKQLLPAALAAGLQETEIRATIRSAHSKPRRPARSFAGLRNTQG